MKKWLRKWKKVWILQLLVNPIIALDLIDKDGKPDHGKILPAILLLSAIVAQFIGRAFAIGALIVLGSLSYGYGAWRTFLKSRTVTSEEKIEDIKQTVTIQRDPTTGIQPTVDRDWNGQE